LTNRALLFFQHLIQVSFRQEICELHFSITLFEKNFLKRKKSFSMLSNYSVKILTLLKLLLYTNMMASYENFQKYNKKSKCLYFEAQTRSFLIRKTFSNRNIAALFFQVVLFSSQQEVEGLFFVLC